MVEVNVGGRRVVAADATAQVVERDGAWRIRLDFDTDFWFVSEQSFPTRGDAEAAFYRWRGEVGAELLTAQ